MRTVATLGLVMCFHVGAGEPVLAHGNTAPAARRPYPGEREFMSCARPASRGKLDIGSREPELLDLIAWISNMGCRRFVIATTTSLQGRRVGIPSAPHNHSEAYRLFYAALQSLDLGLSVVPAGESLRITEVSPRPVAEPDPI